MATLGPINELSTTTYQITLKDKDGNVPSLDSLTLTYCTEEGALVINSRNAQDVLNTNNVTYNGTTGLIEWSRVQADNAFIAGGGSSPQVHVATWSAVWNTGLGRKTWESRFKVTDLAKITV